MVAVKAVVVKQYITGGAEGVQQIAVKIILAKKLLITSSAVTSTPNFYLSNKYQVLSIFLLKYQVSSNPPKLYLSSSSNK